jgi:hypothetical protein
VDTSLPLDDSAVFNDCSVIPVIVSILEHNLNAIAVQIEYSSVEMAILIAASGRGAVGATSSGQGCSIELSHSRTARSGECDVRGAGFYTTLVSCGVPERDRSRSLPRRFLAQKEVGIANAKANLMA